MSCLTIVPPAQTQGVEYFVSPFKILKSDTVVEMHIFDTSGHPVYSEQRAAVVCLHPPMYNVASVVHVLAHAHSTPTHAYSRLGWTLQL